MVTFQVEEWAKVKDEMSWLWPLHWEEVAGDKDKIKLEVWFEAYDELGKQLHIITVRDKETCGKCRGCDNSNKGKIVGYHWSIVRPHLHYKSSLTAYTDIYFLHPEYRKGMNGVNLFKFVEKSLKERGVEKMYIASKVKLDMSKIFERLGWSESEKVYTKYIG